MAEQLLRHSTNNVKIRGQGASAKACDDTVIHGFVSNDTVACLTHSINGIGHGDANHTEEAPERR